MILSDAEAAGPVQPPLRRAWKKLAWEIEEDERFTRRLFLFPEIITPPSFRRHWETIVPEGAIHTIPGVLRQPYCLSRRKARQALGLPLESETLLVQGGGALWEPAARDPCRPASSRARGTVWRGRI
jgi:hypothetical protein